MTPFGLSKRYLEAASDTLHIAELEPDPARKAWYTQMADIAARAAVAETEDPPPPSVPDCDCTRCIRFRAGVKWVR